MADKVSTEDVVMALVREVATEMHPGRPLPAAAGPDSLLDRDFALDSLGRLELAGRIEDAFGISLTEERVANAETPRDLMAAVGGSTDRVETTASTAIAPPPVDEPGARGAVSLPEQALTLLDVLEYHAAETPQRLHIRLYDEDCEAGGPGATLTYGGLRDAARRVAVGLIGEGLKPGEAVALMLPTGIDYFAAFFGVLYAGGVPVPIYPPPRISLISDHIRRHFSILANCRARGLIAGPEMASVATLLKGGVETIGWVTTVAELGQGGDIPLPAVAAGDIAFIQYTSGSTGQPKGVVLSHDNLLANVRAMGRATRATGEDVFVSWLPLYHDMGLIGAWFGSLYHGVELVIMSPLRFLARPERWFQAVHRFGGTLSASPNFGFEACVKRISDAKLQDVDLSSLRVVCNGAEPVSPATIERFTERFEPRGFKRTAMFPVYGLAECSVGLAFPPVDRGPRIEYVDRQALSRDGKADPVEAGAEGAQAVVGCGLALPGHRIRVVDALGHDLPERHEGRLQFLGPSATSGYFRNAEATSDLIDGPWRNSGDRAFLADGEVFITGRAKDMIIRAGRNIYPQELEDAVGDIEGVRKGNVAVFASADPGSGTERLVVLAETRRFDAATEERITRAVEAHAIDLTGQPPDAVVLARPNTVLKTSSGKVRRAACREAYEKGLLGKEGAPPWLQVLRLSLMTLVPTLRRTTKAAAASLYAGYVYAVAALVAPPAWGLIAILPQGLAWSVARSACRLILGLAGIRLVVQGRDTLPGPGEPVIYVANHGSYLDGFVLTLALGRPVAFIAKRELLGHWVTRILLSKMGCLFVERFDREKGLEDARHLVDEARAWRALMFFPEGTFTNRSGIMPFQMGAFTAAAEAGAPVVPIALRGTRSILVDGSWFPRRGRIRAAIGDAIAVDTTSGTHWQQALALRAAARAHILTHAGEPDMAMDRADLLDQVPVKGPQARD